MANLLWKHWRKMRMVPIYLNATVRLKQIIGPTKIFKVDLCFGKFSLRREFQLLREDLRFILSNSIPTSWLVA